MTNCSLFRNIPWSWFYSIHEYPYSLNLHYARALLMLKWRLYVQDLQVSNEKVEFGIWAKARGPPTTYVSHHSWNMHFFFLNQYFSLYTQYFFNSKTTLFFSNPFPPTHTIPRAERWCLLATTTPHDDLAPLEVEASNALR